MTTANLTKVIVPCRLSYAHLWEPDSINGSEPKYSVSCIIDKNDKETIAKIKKAIEIAKDEGKGKWGGKIPANLKTPLRDGDIDRPEDEAYKAAMERENDEWYDFLFHRYMFLKEELDFFEHAVNGLDERHRSIITDLLDEDMTWDIMMERYHVSHTMIGKYRKAALKELDKQYELRDRQVEAFVLG